jgi:uncharacterized protein YfbU (UPF0304 family)
MLPTKVERLSLLNQFEILRRLDPDHEWFPRAIEALEKGYGFEIEKLTEYLHPFKSSEDCQEVRSILAMFGLLGQKWTEVKDPTIEQWRCTFRGFDGHSEAWQMLYAEFIFKGEEFLESAGQNLSCPNSAAEMMPVYRQMLEIVQANDWTLSDEVFRDVVRLAQKGLA